MGHQFGAPFNLKDMARRENFTAYETMPDDLYIYMSHNGPHFNRAACEFAVSNMFTEENGKEVQLKPYTKQQVDNLLATYKGSSPASNILDNQYTAASGSLFLIDLWRALIKL